MYLTATGILKIALVGAPLLVGLRTFSSAMEDKKWACGADGNDDLCEVAGFYVRVEMIRLLLHLTTCIAVCISAVHTTDDPEFVVIQNLRDGLFIFAAWLVAVMSIHSEWFRRSRRKKKMASLLAQAEADARARFAEAKRIGSGPKP